MKTFPSLVLIAGTAMKIIGVSTLTWGLHTLVEAYLKFPRPILRALPMIIIGTSTIMLAKKMLANADKQ